MNLKLQDTTNEDWVLIHDYYQESSEPDAPKAKVDSLGLEERQKAFAHYSSGKFKSIFHENILIGFVGFFPDDDGYVNLFYVIERSKRGKGYFQKLLEAAVLYCRHEFSDYKYIRVLTRRENIPSIRGLEKLSFVWQGPIVEEAMPDVTYEEYLLKNVQSEASG